MVAKNRVLRILIKGITPDKVHGVNLREEILIKALSKGVGGYVANIKGTATVEIIADGKNTKEFLNEIKRVYGSDGKGHGVIHCWEERHVEFDKFEIKREDELTEMVWALRGAGNVFQKLIDTIKKQEEEREEKRAQSLEISIESELNTISETLNSIDLGNTHPRFRTCCIEHFIVEPPIPINRDKILALSGLYNLCNETNQILGENSGDARIKENLGKIREFLESLEKLEKTPKSK